MENNLQDLVRKGTTTVGLVCKEGLVLAADKRVTLGGRIISHKSFEKVVKITDNVAITTAGTVSDIQLITKLLRAELRLKKIRTGKEPTVKTTANLLGTIVYQNIRKFSTIVGITGFLLGGKDDLGFWLYEIGPDGSIITHADFATDGSGMMMAWGVLDTMYKPGVSLQDGIKLAVKAINAAIQRDAASGEGVNVFTITKSGIQQVVNKQIESKLEA